MTTTVHDLKISLRNLAQDMQTAGLPVSRLQLEQGSKTDGRAYRLYLRDPQTGGLSSVPGVWNDGYLGTTRSEAAHALDMLAAGVRMTGEWRRDATGESVTMSVRVCKKYTTCECHPFGYCKECGASKEAHK